MLYRLFSHFRFDEKLKLLLSKTDNDNRTTSIYLHEYIKYYHNALDIYDTESWINSNPCFVNEYTIEHIIFSTENKEEFVDFMQSYLLIHSI